jgi:Cu+-exporting ATPase
MEVNPKTASAKSDYQGRTYYFCSVDDKSTFDKEPQRYAKPSMEQGRSHMHDR